MTQADDRLKALFALDEPPARDPAFSTAVLERMMRRRFQEEVLMLCGVTILGAVGLWVIWPVLEPALVTLSQGFAPALGAVALGVCAWIVLGGRPAAAIGAVS
ncbi:MAG: hypothetical protein ACJ798_05925 [Phenylobacterium sp.]